MQRKMKVKLEYVDDSLYQVYARYVEIDHEPYVMEMIKQLDMDSLIDPQGGEKLIYQLTGYTDKLYEDALTGAHNRRYFEDSVREANQPGTGVVIVDLDDFKQINDTYGHVEGDRALIRIAGVLKKTLAGHAGILARYGGDEFMVVIYNTSKTEIEDILKQLSREKDRLNSSGNIMPIDYACGWAISDADSECTIQMLLDKADYYMYENKQAYKKSKKS